LTTFTPGVLDYAMA